MTGMKTDPSLLISQIDHFRDRSNRFTRSHCTNDGSVRSILVDRPSEFAWETGDYVELTAHLTDRFHVRLEGDYTYSDVASVGRTFMIGPGERGLTIINGECRVIQIRFSRQEIDRILLENHDETGGFQILRQVRHETDFNILRLLAKALIHEGAMRHISIQAIVAALLERYGSPKGSHRRGLTPATLRRVQDLVHSDLVSVTLEAMAAIAGLSLYHFAREFRRETGQSPWRYVTEKRVWSALEMLGSGFPVCDAARAAGFAHSSHMGRAFQRQFGLSPSAIRRLLLP